MKRVAISQYGKPEVLTFQEGLPIPVPRTGEVVMKVHAHGLNPKDKSQRKGQFKYISNRKFPKPIGSDAAGVIEAVGPDVIRWKPGDRVMGYLAHPWGGAAAEYCLFKETAIASIPAGMEFTTAAAIPCAYLTALQVLRDVLKVKKGDRLLIIGASGGVGGAAVQIAKIMDVHVTALSSTTNQAYCRALGADEALSYQTDDPYAARYDAVFCIHGGRQPFYRWARTALSRRGRFVTLSPNASAVANIILSRLIPNWPKFYFWPVRASTQDLDQLNRWIEKGKLSPQLGQVLPWEQIVAAHQQIDTNHTRGKLVVTIA